MSGDAILATVAIALALLIDGAAVYIYFGPYWHQYFKNRKETRKP